MKKLVLVWLLFGCIAWPATPAFARPALPDCAEVCTPSADCNLACSELGFQTSCADYGVCNSAPNTTYCAFPVIVESSVLDIHEGATSGPPGFGYFAAAGDAKAGALPLSMGASPKEYFDTCMWASNFQGPLLLHAPGGREQWEFTANDLPPGNGEVSTRRYPVIYAQQCVASPSQLGSKFLQVKEHDELGTTDDQVGAFTVDRGLCDDEVFGQGMSSGWTSVHRAWGEPYSSTYGPDDIDYVDYKVWCYKCTSGGDCRYQVGPQRVPQVTSLELSNPFPNPNGTDSCTKIAFFYDHLYANDPDLYVNFAVYDITGSLVWETRTWNRLPENPPLPPGESGPSNGKVPYVLGYVEDPALSSYWPATCINDPEHCTEVEGFAGPASSGVYFFKAWACETVTSSSQWTWYNHTASRGCVPP